MNSGNSSLSPRKQKLISGPIGGNSGMVVSPAPGLGLSAYQNPKQAVKKSPTSS